YTPYPRRRSSDLWTEEEYKLLATLSDHLVAKVLDRSIYSVKRRRRGRRLFRREPSRPWTAEELAVVGTRPDIETARLLGRGLPAVRAKRTKLGPAPRNSGWKHETDQEMPCPRH